MREVEAGRVEEVMLEQLDRRYAALRLVSPAEVARVRASIQREGMRNPLMVSTGVEAERLVLIDGFKRVRVLMEMEVKEARAVLLTLDGPTSEVAILQCNVGHRGLCDLEEAWVIRSLVRVHRVSQVQVGLLLSRHKSWVCRRLKLAEQLDEAVQEDIRLGLVSSTVARELVRLPRGNQMEVSAVIRTHGLSSRQAAQLITLWLKTEEPDARRDVLADPLLYLSKRNDERPLLMDPRLGDGGNEMRRSLVAMGSACDRAARACWKYTPAGLSEPEATLLGPLIEQTVRAGKSVVSKLEQLTVSGGHTADLSYRTTREEPVALESDTGRTIAGEVATSLEETAHG